MAGYADRNGHYPAVRELEDGTVEAPEGGIQLSDDIIRYRVGGKHWYLHLPTLQWMKGLTTILRNAPMEEGLLRWIASHGSYDGYMQALSAAGQRGTNVHRGIERLLAGETLKRPEYSEEEWKHLASWIDWHNEQKPETRAIEQPIADTRRKIATAIDWRGVLHGKHTSFNWKTSSDIHEEAVIQSNEEAIIYNDQGQFDDLGPIQQHGIVRTGTKHKVGYEMVLFEIDQQRHAYFDHLVAIEQYNDPKWMPVFPKPMPYKLAISADPEEYGASRNGHKNGRA